MKVRIEALGPPQLVLNPLWPARVLVEVQLERATRCQVVGCGRLAAGHSVAEPNVGMYRPGTRVTVCSPHLPRSLWIDAEGKIHAY